MNVLVIGAERALAGAIAAALRPRDEVFEVEASAFARPREIHDLVGGFARAHGIEAVFHDPAPGHAASSTALLLHACRDHSTIRRFVLRSCVEVYTRDRFEPILADEDAPLALAGGDRVAADVTACAHAADGPLQVAVLRFADILDAEVPGPLVSYLSSRVCLRPLGFDPMIGVLSLVDAVSAAVLAIRSEARGAFDIPGAEALPLSLLLERCGRRSLAVPGVLVPHELRGAFHLGTIQSGRRARLELGYRPDHRVAWENTRAFTTSTTAR